MTASTDSTKPDMSTTAGKIADLRNRLTEARTPMGEDSIRERHSAGLLTARDRVEALLDADSFVEIDALARHRATAYGSDKSRPLTDGVVSGHGTIDGRPVCVFSQDSTIFDGQLGETHGEKILKVIQLALKSGTPLIGIYEGTGARLKEGVAALEYFSRILSMQNQASGVIPHIALVAGAVSGLTAHNVALADVVVEVAQAGQVSLAAGAGSSLSDATSGTAHVQAEDDRAALDLVADVLSYLPSNNRALPIREDEDERQPAAENADLNTIVPDEAAQAYSMATVVENIVDGGSFLGLQTQFAPHMLTGFARIDGRSVGIIANQPDQGAGAIDIDAAEKAARFIRFCDAFNIPLVTFVDSAGFTPDADGAGLVRKTAKLFAATAEASVGKIAVVTRKAYGSAYLAMGAKRMGTDLVFAWPTAEIAVAELDDLVMATGKDEARITEDQINPYAAAERGLVDAVIAPADTRKQIADGLLLLERKAEDRYPRKYSNIPF